MNENKERADRLRKLADEIEPSVNPVGEKPKPVSISPLNPKPDNLAWAREEAKKKKSLDKSKQLSR